MQGHKPYIANSKREIKEKVMIKQYEIKSEEIPKGWSLECADFINKLIMRKPMDRLGFNGIEEVKNHPWFATVNWRDYYDKKIKPPFVNLNIDDAYSRILCSPEKKDMKKRNPEILKKNNSNFRDFIYYDKKSLNNLKNKTIGFKKCF
jgi:serine/threonine protein kinase